MIVYTYGTNLYLNITNRCPCDCVFCVRSKRTGLGNADSLWLPYEPDVEEILKELENYSINADDEIVFCGYGEPTERLDCIVAVSKELKRKYSCKIRLDTNGMGSLINGYDIVPLLSENIDSISISLNAPDEESYLSVTGNKFGKGCFDELISFIKECVETIENVTVSIVSGYISEIDEIRCQKLAKELGARFRVR